jgi:hypothetical protein
MKKLLVLLFCVGVLFYGVAASAVVLDFEDLSGKANLPTNYHGLTWDSHWQYYDYPQSPYNPSSGFVRIYTWNYGGWINFGTDVIFQGSWVASYDVGQTMYWEGYHQGTKIFESAHLSGGAQAYLNVNWPGVDYVNFVCTAYDYFIIDDVKYNVIPLPGAIWLLGTGLLGLGATSWRKKL